MKPTLISANSKNFGALRHAAFSALARSLARSATEKTILSGARFSLRFKSRLAEIKSITISAHVRLRVAFHEASHVALHDRDRDSVSGQSWVVLPASKENRDNELPFSRDILYTHLSFAKLKKKILYPTVFGKEANCVFSIEICPNISDKNTEFHYKLTQPIFFTFALFVH